MNTRRPKNPFIAALLAFLIGPFGFLYFSWKAALVGILLVIFWTEKARSWSGTDSVPLWWPFLVTPACALYAYVSVRTLSGPRRSAGEQPKLFSLRGLGLLLYGVAIYNGIAGLIALAHGGNWGVRFLAATVTFLLGFLLWWRSPEQTWNLPPEAIAELRTRLGPQFTLLRSLDREGLLPKELFQNFSVPTLVLHLNVLALKLAAAKRTQDAEEAFRVALRLDPDNVASKAGLSGILADSGRLEEASQYAKECLNELRPGIENMRPMLEEIVRIAGSRLEP